MVQFYLQHVVNFILLAMINSTTWVGFWTAAFCYVWMLPGDCTHANWVKPDFDVTVYMVLATPLAKSRLFESLRMGFS